MSDFFARSEQVLGCEAMARLAAARVLVGIGGVGSWCAEALVRTGLGRIVLVDDDCVAESNVNRQCPATAKTVGRPKVEVMAERLREINPGAEVEGRATRFGCPTDGTPGLGDGVGDWRDFDAVVDAIDSVDCKAELILGATAAGVPLVSSMGAAFRKDPTKVRVTRFEDVLGDGLARALRRRFKLLGRFPARPFACVWSSEPASRPSARAPQSSSPPKGSLMQVTATFGMCLASAVVDSVSAPGDTFADF